MGLYPTIQQTGNGSPFATETKTITFTHGLKEGDFFRSLIKKIPRDFEDLLSRAEKYINMEESQKLKRESVRKDQDERPGRANEKSQKGHPLGHFSQYMHLRFPRDQVVHEMEEKVKIALPPPPDKHFETKFFLFMGNMLIVLVSVDN